MEEEKRGLAVLVSQLKIHMAYGPRNPRDRLLLRSVGYAGLGVLSR